MADLIHLRFRDFRAFRTATVDLPANGVVLLAGPNNVGKSALLSGFDVLAAQDFPAAARHIAGEQAKVWARWYLTENERVQLLGNDLKASQLIQNGAATWLEWECGEFQGRVQPVAVSISWPDRERLEIARLESNAQGWRLSKARMPLVQWDQSQFAISGTNGGHMQDTASFFTDSDFVRLPYEVIHQWREGYFHFKPLRESKGRTWHVESASSSLNSDGANLANVLLWLNTNEPAIFQQVASLAKQIVPGVGQLMIPVNGNQCTIVFQDDQVPSHRHNIKDLGTGVEQLLMTLVLGLTQTATTVIMEEPETGLHHGAQRALLGLLQEWSQDRLFVASTHSATMLDWRSPSTRVISVSRTGTESTATTVTTDRATVLRDLGIRLSDVLSAERILIVEGATDKDIFEVWFPDIVRDPHVAMIGGEGGYNAHHAELFVRWLGEADQLGPRQVLYARDRDELSTKFLEKLEKSAHVYVLPCRELENLLLDSEALAAAINDERGKNDEELVGIDEIEASLKELAEQFRQIVVLKRTMADLADPIRLVDNDLRKSLTKTNADQATLTERVLARVPSTKAVEASITESWQRHSKEVDEAWDQEWRCLAPGADLLCVLWQRFLNRKYDKGTDGLAVAKIMKQPPADLAHAMAVLTDEASGQPPPKP